MFVKCKNCQSEYNISTTQEIKPDGGFLNCEDCGAMLHSWTVGVVWTIKEKLAPQRLPTLETEPHPLQTTN